MKHHGGALLTALGALASLGLSPLASPPSLDAVARATATPSRIESAFRTGTASSPAPRDVEVVANEYAFHAPTEMPAGRTAFHFVNRGKVHHEMLLVLLAPGVSIGQFVKAADPEKPDDPATDRLVEATVGVLFAGPGERAPGSLVEDLLPGRTYALRCTSQDGPTGKSHQTLGMFLALHVTSAPSPAATPVHADTIVATDYAFRYRNALPPGAHAIALVNAGQRRHEVYLALLRKGVTLEKFMALARAQQDPTPLLERTEGILYTRGGTSSRGALEVELLPARDYVIVCTFTDSAQAPMHLMLGMFGRIHVAGQ